MDVIFNVMGCNVSLMNHLILPKFHAIQLKYFFISFMSVAIFTLINQILWWRAGVLLPFFSSGGKLVLNTVMGPLQLLHFAHEVRRHLLAGLRGDQVQSTVEGWHVPANSVLSGEARQPCHCPKLSCTTERSVPKRGTCHHFWWFYSEGLKGLSSSQMIRNPGFWLRIDLSK